MKIFKFDRDELRNRLQSIDEWKQMAFALSVCERLYPNYVAFTQETDWGKPEKLRVCLDTAWCRLSDGNPQIRLAEMAEVCEAAAPDTEDFQSKYTSAALDSALSTANLMRLLNFFEQTIVLDIAEAAYETADLFTFTDVKTTSALTAEDGRQALQHPVVQNELQNQKEDIDLLAGLDGVFADYESMLRDKWVGLKPLSLKEAS